MPASGSAKSLGSEFLEINHLFLRQLLQPGNPTNGNLWPVFGASFLFATGFLFYGLIRILPRKGVFNSAETHELFLPVCISLSLVIFTLYSLFGSSWILWRWYGYLLFPMAIIVYPFLFAKVLSTLNAFPSFRKVLTNIGILLALIACLPMFQTTIKRGLWSSTLPQGFRYENYQVANILNESLPAGSVVAMGDRAGSFAYFFHGRVLQLEGLVGEEALLQAIQEDTLAKYMTQFGVDYVLSYWQPPASYERWTLLTPLPGFSIGPQAGIEFCKDRETLRYLTPEQALSLWEWPGCVDNQ